MVASRYYEMLILYIEELKAIMCGCFAWLGAAVILLAIGCVATMWYSRHLARWVRDYRLATHEKRGRKGLKWVVITSTGARRRDAPNAMRTRSFSQKSRGLYSAAKIPIYRSSRSRERSSERPKPTRPAARQKEATIRLGSQNASAVCSRG
jgi:hypothetical protein